MSLPTFTVVVPTLGRLPGLRHTLDSIQRQALIAGDRVLVVLDSFEQGARPDIRAIVEGYGYDYVEHDGGSHWYGIAQLNHAMTLAKTDFLLALGDDDVYVDGAFERLRPKLETDRAALCQFLSPWRTILWDKPALQVSHISGCCLIAPVSALVPIGPDRRVEVDFAWIKDVIAKSGQEPIWIPDCLILARPDVRQGEPVRTLEAMRRGRGLKVLLVSPGASTSTADVEAGLRYGLVAQGVDVVQYRLDSRIDRSRRWLHTAWRRAKKTNPAIERPTIADVFYQAGVGAIEMSLRHQVDVVLVVSAMLLHPDVVILLKRAGLRVVVLFTESPYDLAQELKVAALVDGCWTNERTSVEAFRRANPNSGYLPHGWHPQRHLTGPQPGDDAVLSHDVVFVGSAFRERVEWLSEIDWTGIDLGLYGSWESLGSRHPLRRYVCGAQIDNVKSAALYRRAKIGLNLYRTSHGWGKDAAAIAHAESLNPRAYELAACGAFSLSTYRAEVEEVFGDRVPTFETPDQAEGLIRRWLAAPEERAQIAAELPALVAESSWTVRASTVIGDLQTLLQQRAA